MPIVGQFGSLAGLGSMILPGGAFESIATVTVGSGGASSITFSDIPGGFQHLQIRGIAQQATTGNYAEVTMTGATFARRHYLYGNGTSALAASDTTNAGIINTSPANSGANIFAATILDLLDYTSTTKNKVTRSFMGDEFNGSGTAYLVSGLYTSTAAITAITLTAVTKNFTQYTTFALYGVRA